MTLSAVAGDARMPGRTHDVHSVIAGSGVALGAGRIRRDVIRGLAAARHVGREGGRRRVAAVAVAAGRMALVECCRGTGVTRRRRSAGNHAEVRRGLVTGLAAADAARAADGGVTGDRQGGRGEARGSDMEAARVDVGGRVAAGAVAVEAVDRDVIARARDHGDVGKRTDRRGMT